jgi:hypothetical protein
MYTKFDLKIKTDLNRNKSFFESADTDIFGWLKKWIVEQFIILEGHRVPLGTH